MGLRHFERVYEELWVTEAKNKDAGKELLQIIITDDKQELAWSYSQDQKYWVGFKGWGYVYHSGKRRGIYKYMYES